MPWVTTVLQPAIPGQDWEPKTIVSFLADASDISSQLSHRTLFSTLHTSTSDPPQSASTAPPTAARTFPGANPTVVPQQASSSSGGSKGLWVIPVAVSLAVFVLIVVVLFVLWKKGKLGKLNPYQNPYVRKMKRDAQMQRVRKVEEERRATVAGGYRGKEVPLATITEEGASRR